MNCKKRKFIPEEKGFTLIELLIIIFVVGILAAIVTVNVISFQHRAQVSSANIELANVLVANKGYYAQNDRTYAASSDELESNGFLDKSLQGSYTFDTDTGSITGTPDSGYSDVTWNASSSRFE